jgi:hypothetical protein
MDLRKWVANITLNLTGKLIITNNPPGYRKIYALDNITSAAINNFSVKIINKTKLLF